jgi:hypothetical protein
MRARGIGREGWVFDNPIREIPKYRPSSIGCAPKARFAPDSLLEERGFEPLIPPGAVTLHMARLLDMPAA